MCSSDLNFDNDRSGLSLRTLSSETEREAALSILSEVLQRPAFPQTVLEREKKRLVSSLREAETKPEFLAERAFGRAVFGSHPYGWQTSVSDVEKIQRAELLDFYRAQFLRRRGCGGADG